MTLGIQSSFISHFCNFQTSIASVQLSHKFLILVMPQAFVFPNWRSPLSRNSGRESKWLCTRKFAKISFYWLTNRSGDSSIVLAGNKTYCSSWFFAKLVWSRSYLKTKAILDLKTDPSKYLRSTEHTIYVASQSRGIYEVPRVLIVDARSFQALAAILHWLTHLASSACWHRSYAFLKPLYCEFRKYEVMFMSVIGGQPKKKTKTQIPVISNKTHWTHFCYLWLLLY